MGPRPCTGTEVTLEYERSERVLCWPQFDAWPRVRMNGEMLREIHNKMVSDICVPIQWSCPAQPSTAEGLLNVATQHRTLCNSSVSMLWRMYNIRILMSNCGTLVDCRLRHLRYEIDCRYYQNNFYSLCICMESVFRLSRLKTNFSPAAPWRQYWEFYAIIIFANYHELCHF